MPFFDLLLIALLLMIIGLISYVMIFAKKTPLDDEPLVKELRHQLLLSHQEITTLRQTLTNLQNLHASALSDKSRLEKELELYHQKTAELKLSFEEQKQALRDEITLTLKKILDGKIQTFDETSTKSLQTLLEPFKMSLETFKQRVELSQKENHDKMIALSKELEYLQKASFSIGQEAANLTKALKGEKQTQGRWGEMILESVLEHSGLVRNEHYTIQESYRDEQGHNKRPDVIVKLPGDKTLIIDSKVSLVDYDHYVRADTEEERTIAATAIAKAFRNHIETLSSKDYAHYSLQTLEYIFMFVPIEGAYAVAVGQDPTLYETALKHHIVIVYPSTLIVTLKTVAIYWQREKSDQTIALIYQEAGKLYDKMYAFIETYEKLGRTLESAASAFHDGSKHLYQGKGNIIKRTESLRLLGAKTTKQLKNLKIQQELIADEIEELELIETPSSHQNL